MLTIRSFAKSFSENLIVSIPFLELKTGVYWIKGENGSGKTTFFKSLAGLIPAEGTIEFNDGISLHSHPIQYRKRVNYSEAEPLYPGFLTSKDLIRFIGHARSSSLEQQQHLVEKFGIDKFYEKSCDTYSSGMLKKLSLAIAFLGSPKIIILDELLITLDESARQVLLSLIKQYAEENQVTFFLSSHQKLNSTAIDIKQTFYIENKKLLPIEPS